jgi:hypothetical protein
MPMQSKFKGSCKDGCGADWQTGTTIFKRDDTGNWCSNAQCSSVAAGNPRPQAAKPAPIPKLKPEDAIMECQKFVDQFNEIKPEYFESLAKIYISRMMSNR